MLYAWDGRVAHQLSEERPQRMSDRRLMHLTLIDSLIDRLEADIISGEYPADSRLPGEEALSREFDVSRPIVREALARLRERGYVTTLNGRGTFVRRPDIASVSQSMQRHLQMSAGTDYSVDDLYEARRTIELEASALAATRASDAQIERLERFLTLMSESAPADPEAYTTADASFHLEIAQATQNSLFSVLTAPLLDGIVHGMFHSVNASSAGMTSGVAEHRRILDCIRSGDAEGARREMANHLSNSRLAYPTEDAGPATAASDSSDDASLPD